MVVEQFEFNEINDIDKLSEMCTLVESNLILMFGSKEFICNKDIFDKIRGYYKTAYIIGCSTAGVGLTIAHDVIVKRHHGEFDVKSIPGKETIFIFKFKSIS
ncbi:hypothetical protein [Clostridium saccharoperbutylacetonicum]|uniref:hypothetical protein n=1 Tax=Clostridium saccharoperbutylacetonicum TaxID=36745 RepID=UPI0039E85C4A